MSVTNNAVVTRRFRVPARGVLLALALSALATACNAGGVEEEILDEQMTGEVSSELASRSYRCGFALPGYGCNNGRASRSLVAADLASALAACPSVQPAGYTDFCYVLDEAGPTPTDVTQCTAAAGSWRAGNNCCNFRGTLSCPTRSYTCGYALPGYNCDNGRSSRSVVAGDLATARTACGAAQPSGYTDSCYIIDASGATQTDVFQCAQASASWRSGNNCCNIKGTVSCPLRSYRCGYALPGYGCNNGRSSKSILAADLTTAISACRAAQPAAYSDFCYVLDEPGATQSDVFQCAEASGSWRTGNSCCNFMGTLSCP